MGKYIYKGLIIEYVGFKIDGYAVFEIQGSTDRIYLSDFRVSTLVAA